MTKVIILALNNILIIYLFSETEQHILYLGTNKLKAYHSVILTSRVKMFKMQYVLTTIMKY